MPKPKTLTAQIEWERHDEMLKISHNTYFLLQTLRYFLNPNHSIKSITFSPLNCSPLIPSFDSSTGFPPDCSITSPFRPFSNSIPICSSNSRLRFPITASNLGLFRRFSDCSLYSTSVETVISDKTVNQVIEVVRIGGDDCVSKLNSMGLALSLKSISEILRILSLERIPALSFYKWVRDRNPSFSCNAHVCSLMIDNCGWVGDYETMISLLKEFKGKRICLTDKAFSFLTNLVSCDATRVESIRAVVEVLNEIGGSCRGSGICAMISVLCMLDSFEMAKFVIEITDRNVSYYNIVMRGLCRTHRFDEARGLVEEMRGLGCELKADTYNYLLGSLCKSDRISEACILLDEMLETDTLPDAITFEVFIFYYCRIGKLDVANRYYNQMMSWGIEARITSHAAILEGYFSAGMFEQAHKYVHAVGVGVPSSYMVYSLLAKLHHKKGDLVVAQRILMEMMDKDLKPYFPIYMNIVKGLKKTGRRHLALDLKNGFSRFFVEPRTKTG